MAAEQTDAEGDAAVTRVGDGGRGARPKPPVVAKPVGGIGLGHLGDLVDHRELLPQALRAEAQVVVAVISGVVLAAGTGSRFGGTKQLVAVDGKPLAQHAIDALDAAGVDEIIVVTGHDAVAVGLGADAPRATAGSSATPRTGTARRRRSPPRCTRSTTTSEAAVDPDGRPARA